MSGVVSMLVYLNAEMKNKIEQEAELRGYLSTSEFVRGVLVKELGVKP